MCPCGQRKHQIKLRLLHKIFCEPTALLPLSFTCVALVSCIALRNERQRRFIPLQFCGTFTFWTLLDLLHNCFWYIFFPADFADHRRNTILICAFLRHLPVVENAMAVTLRLQWSPIMKPGWYPKMCWQKNCTNWWNSYLKQKRLMDKNKFWWNQTTNYRCRICSTRKTMTELRVVRFVWR